MPTDEQKQKWAEEMRRINDPAYELPTPPKRQKLAKTALEAINAALRAARLENCAAPQDAQDAMRLYLETHVCKPLEEVLRFSAGEIELRKNLSDRLQKSLRMREEGKTFSEIGEAQGVTAETARQHCLKAERYLRRAKARETAEKAKMQKNKNLDLNQNLLKSIDELDLSIRATIGLKAAGITRVGELVRQTEDALHNTKNFSRKSLREISRALERMGLSFGMIEGR